MTPGICCDENQALNTMKDLALCHFTAICQGMIRILYQFILENPTIRLKLTHMSDISRTQLFLGYDIRSYSVGKTDSNGSIVYITAD